METGQQAEQQVAVQKGVEEKVKLFKLRILDINWHNRELQICPESFCETFPKDSEGLQIKQRKGAIYYYPFELSIVRNSVTFFALLKQNELDKYMGIMPETQETAVEVNAPSC